jgi:membrane-bound lytic murein transglycosylase B
MKTTAVMQHKQCHTLSMLTSIVRTPLAVLGLTVGLMASAQAATFAECLSGLKAEAVLAGIPEVLVRDSLDSLTPQQDVLRLDRTQPEFTKGFADYHGKRVTDAQVAKAQQLWRDNQALFDRIFAKYQVQPQYLLAFWGLESNFGGYFGKTPTIQALATLACDGRRSDFFKSELMNALKIVNEGAISAQNMTGSWAGAMGHMQFMPSTFLNYAVDADGDGRRNIWSSQTDALTSAANYLHSIGWDGDYRWGREVYLPDGFDYRVASIKNKMALAQWAALGVRTSDGKLIPDAPIQAALIVPTGHEGPAFLVYGNFDMIMEWNRSESYALAVGLLADRIAGVAEPSKAFVSSPTLYFDQVKQMQNKLNEMGYNAGEADGVFGSGTRSAISRYQAEHKMVADGFPDAEVLKALAP